MKYINVKSKIFCTLEEKIIILQTQNINFMYKISLRLNVDKKNFFF